jgi:hypothetical protein
MNYFGEHKEEITKHPLGLDQVGEMVTLYGQTASVCGCGKMVKYEVSKGVFACNKHNRCPVDASAHGFHISFAVIDAKETNIISMFGEGAYMSGRPEGLHNYIVYQQAIKDYLEMVYSAQIKIRKQILLEMIPPEVDTKATEQEMYAVEVRLPNSLESLWDC